MIVTIDYPGSVTKAYDLEDVPRVGDAIRDVEIEVVVTSVVWNMGSEYPHRDSGVVHVYTKNIGA